MLIQLKRNVIKFLQHNYLYCVHEWEIVTTWSNHPSSCCDIFTLLDMLLLVFGLLKTECFLLLLKWHPRNGRDFTHYVKKLEIIET